MKEITYYTEPEPARFFLALLYSPGKTRPEYRYYRTAGRAVKAAKAHADKIGRPGYWSQVREETIYRRTPDTEISSSGPYWFSDKGYYHYSRGAESYYSDTPPAETA